MWHHRYRGKRKEGQKNRNKAYTYKKKNMNTGEDITSLRKIMDFTRLISVVILAIHFYISCYGAFTEWHWTAKIVTRLVLNIAKTGLFRNNLRPKLGALLF